MDTIESLQLINVFDHGVANLERIGIYVAQPCDLSEYCLLLGIPSVEGGSTPIKDHMLWFGHGFVEEGDWVMVYTASGTTTITPNHLMKRPNHTPRVINIHWGKDHTIFQNRAITPLLVRISGVGTLNPPEPTYQGDPTKDRKRIL